MAQLHINATVTKNSPIVYLPGDQRAELKSGDYFKVVGIAGVYEIGAISLIGTDTQIQLTAPFLGESGNYPALIHRDFSPEQGYPLIYAGDLDIPDLLRRWALQADSAPAAAVDAHVSEADPHPQYTTVAEAAAAAPVQSVVGRTGAVTAQQVADALDLGTAATRDVTTSPTDTTPGRVLKVGDFGVGGAATGVPGNNIDNSSIPAGFYYVISTTSGTKPAGDDGYGHLIVSREGSGITVRQLYLDNTTDRIWTRVWKPSQWSTWQELYHSGNINTANAGTATKLQTARTLTIGNTGKAFDGSADVSWSLDEIGAARVVRISGSTDLNTAVNSGFYRLGNPVVNAPVGVQNGQLIVARGGDTIVQIVAGHAGGEIYWRQGNPPDVGGPGSWSGWYRFFHSGNFGAASLGSNGYQKLPSGLIIQWGLVQCSTSGPVDWTYPLTFPNQVLCVGPLGVLAASPQFANVSGSTPVKVSVSAWNAEGARSANSVFMLAIGY